MPAIQAYKYKGKIIPVAEAKVGRAYVCPWTRKLYSTKSAYVKHLGDLRITRMHRRARANRWQRLGGDLWNQSNFEKIIAWVELHPEWFLDNAERRGFYSDAKRFDSVRDSFSVKITYLELTWSDSVSNTHSCPHNGVTNWGSDRKDAPRGYPGWRGRIEYEISHEIPGFSSSLMEGSRIHIGSGGGGGLKYGYSVQFFADDWPELQAQRVMDILASREPGRIQIGKPSR
jgi:hypothetical protein